MNMKKILTATVLFLLFIILLNNCRIEDKTDIEDKITIAVVNPAVGSLQGIQSLIENNIIDVPGLQILAVCYQKAENDWEAVKGYVNNSETDIFRFERIDGVLSDNTLFKDNELTEPFREIFDKTDGIIFLGGADFPPVIYGEKTRLLTNIRTPFRHYFELSFLFHLIGGSQDTIRTPLLASKPAYPVIGFCLGMQSMNVASGGSMYQDIPSDIYGLQFVEEILALDKNQLHKNYWQNISPDDKMIWSNFHQIKSQMPFSIFDHVLWENNTTPFVYSSHHQTINKLGLDIKVVATSIDEKVVEIIAHNKWKHVFGVQFHPEVASLYVENGSEYKWQPNDTLLVSYKQFLIQNRSLNFHKNFWQKVSEIFRK